MRESKRDNMRLSQEAIQRMIIGRSGGGAGGGGSFDPSELAGMASQAWVEDGYISKAFWNELFIIHKKVTTVVMNGETEVSRTVKTDADAGVDPFDPNETPSETSTTDSETGYVTTVTTEIESIEARKGVWTDYFLSALGKNSSGGGGGASLNQPLQGINESGLGLPPQGLAGKVGIVWNYATQRYEWGETGGGAGSVTSVGLTMPTGFSVSPTDPITSNGTFAVSFAEGYSLPTTAKQTNWDDAYDKRHEHTNKSVLDGITSEKVSAWDGVAAIMASPDQDTIINKWQEVVSFLDTYTEADTLAGLLSNKLDVSVANSDFLKKTDAANTYVTKTYFESLFELWNDNTTPSSKINVNTDISTFTAAQKEKLNIKSMFGFWTEKYISALGKNDDEGGITLNEPLNTINNSGLGTPSQSGVAIMWNGSAWTYQVPGGSGGGGGTVTSVGMTVPTGFVVNGQPVTGSGTIGISFANGYSLPLTADVAKGVTAYGLVNGKHFVDYVGETDVDFNFTDEHDLGGGVYQLHTRKTQTNKPMDYGILVDFESVNGHLQFAAGTNDIRVRSYWWTNNPAWSAYPAWKTLAFTDSNISGNAGSATKLQTARTIWGNSFDGTGNINGNISYTGSKSTDEMIKFVDNTNDVNGNGIAIGGGGLVAIGGGESSLVLAAQASGGDERMMIGNDGSIEFYSNLQGGWTNRKTMTFDTSGNLNVESGKVIVTYGTADGVWGTDNGGFLIKNTSASNPYCIGLAANNAGYGEIQTSQIGIGATNLVLQKKGGNVGIGNSAPTYKLDVNGAVNCTSIRIGGITVTADNGGLHVNSAGLYADTYLSALGLSSSGSGNVSALYDLVDVNISGASNGQALVYRNGIWKNETIQSGGSGTVTSVATGTGLTGGTITSSGTISINSTYQTYISHGESAYNSLSSYLPLSAGSTKPLTGSLYLNGRGMGIFEPYSSVNIPLIYDNGENLWIGATQTATTHHTGQVYISAGYNGTSGNSTINICVPNASNTGGTNYGVLHSGNYTDLIYSKSQSDNRYLQLTGGELTGYLGITSSNLQPLVVNSTAPSSTGTFIQFKHSGTAYGGLLMDAVNGSLKRYDTSFNTYTLFDSGNSGIVDGHKVKLNGTSIEVPVAYYIPSPGTFTSGYWHKLGTYVTAGDASSLVLTIYNGKGYNSQAEQNSFARIVIKDGWQSTRAAKNSVGVTIERFGNYFALECRIVATADNAGAVWIYFPLQYASGTYEVSGQYTSWTHNPYTNKPEDGGPYDYEYNDGPATNQGIDFSSSVHAYLYLDNAYKSDNVASATKLQTARSLWGNSFDGSADLTGDITIGTSSSASKLIIYGAQVSDDTKGLFLRASDNTNRAWITWNGNVSSTDYMNIHTGWGNICLTPNKNVGIGTTAPSYKLHVNGEAMVANSIYTDGHLIMHTGSTGICLNSSGTGIDWHNSSNQYVASVMAFSQTQVNVTASAGLKIGNAVLQYESGTNSLKLVHATNGASVNFYATGGVSALGMSSNSSGQVNGDIIPSLNGSYTIGSGSKGWTDLFLSDGCSGTLNIYADSGEAWYSSSGRHVFEDPVVVSDYLNVNGSNASYNLYVSGKSYLTNTLCVGGTSSSYMLYVSGTSNLNGNVYVNGTLTHSSDMRMKDFVENTDIDVEAIARAPLFKFTWRDKTIDLLTHIGTSAQYWQGVAAETVTADGAGTLGLDYGVTALASVISVARKVMTHEERIAALEAENERLRNEIETLKAA